MTDGVFSDSPEELYDDEFAEDGMALSDSVGGDFILGAAASASSSPPTPLTDDEKLKKLVDTQSFNGAFKVESNLAELLHITLDDLLEAGKRESYSDQVWMTLVALAYLNLTLSQLESSWILVANKAEKWLATQQLKNESVAKAAAQEFIKSSLKL